MEYTLEGVNGNCFAILNYVQSAMKKEHMSKEDLNSYFIEATCGDYDLLLAISINMIEKLNIKKAGDK